jgi:ABC-type transport system involved in multi-copper enzyme maturation permease subunit
VTRFPARALVKKELLPAVRSRWLFVIVSVCVAAVIAVVWMAWPVHPLYPDYIARVSRELLAGVNGVLLAVCALVVPSIAATAISRERDAETLDQLLSTLLNPTGIVAGKLAGIVGTFLLMVLALLPAIGCILFSAGVDWVQVCWSFSMLVFVATSCAGLGLMFSAFFRSSTTATVATYAGVLLIPFGGALILTAVFVEWLIPQWMVPRNIEPFLWMVCPVPGVIDCSDAEVWQFPGALGYQVSVVVMSVAVAAAMLRRESRRAPRSQGPVLADVTTLEARRRRFPYYLIDPAQPRKPIRDGRNPVLVKELRSGFAGRATAWARVFYGSFFVLSVILLFILLRDAYSSAYWRGYAQGVFEAIIIETVLIVCVVPAILAPVFSKEDQQGNTDMLRMTLLTPWQIVWGKLLSGIVAVSSVVLGAMSSTVLVFVTWLQEPKVLGVLFTGFVTLTVCVLLSLSLGVLASVFTRRTGSSIALSYGLSFIAFIGLYVGTCVVLALWGAPRATVDEVMCLSPILAFADNFWTYGKRASSLSEGNLALISGYFLSVTLVYFAVICGPVWLSARYFAEYRMQER